MDKKFVYADNAATTRVSQRVLDAMLPYYREHFGNPSALYSIAAESKEAVDKARAQVAAAIHAEPDEIYFVSCGTEADNWAIKGAARANKNKGAHFISTPFEHHAVLHSLETLVQESGAEVTYLPVYAGGIVKVEDLAAAIRPDTVLVTIMFANNEIGTVQPIAEIGALCRERGVLFHTDAVQAVGHLPIDVKAQNIDMLSMSGHKFHGPKGCGVLYIRRGVKLPNFMDGGGQEKKRRAGTENVAQIVGIGEAIEAACGKLESEAKRLSAMRDRLMDGILAKIPNSRVNGDRTHRLPGNVNVSIEFVEGESMLMLLNMKGICAASGSACTSGSLTPSHVLTSIGLPAEIAHGSLRLTFAEESTEADVDYILEVLPGIVERLRAMSPLSK
ncbi:MAG TPA: cysteine desulfurase NifS [Candidatus Acidoferrum sp.]|nr:cysteine desulfurase NifS [Candidatus Acidoferrum sp.]